MARNSQWDRLATRWLATHNLLTRTLLILFIYKRYRFHDGNLLLGIVNLRWLLLFFIKWERWAVLDISKFFVQRRGCSYMYTLPLIYGRSIKWRQTIEMSGNISDGNFLGGNFPGGNFEGIVWWVGITRVGIFREPILRKSLCHLFHILKDITILCHYLLKNDNFLRKTSND